MISNALNILDVNQNDLEVSLRLIRVHSSSFKVRRYCRLPTLLETHALYIPMTPCLKSTYVNYDRQLTLSRSFLSARLAHISSKKYKPNITMTTMNTIGLFKSSSRLILLQSMLFGGTKKSPAKDVACVVKHCVTSLVVLGPT
jgi:hypothetical protein